MLFFGVKLLITGENYENIGTIPGKEGKEEKGYRLVYIQRIDGNDHYIVSAAIIPLNQNETTVAKQLVEEAIAGKEFGYLTSLPVNNKFQTEKVYLLYSKRWKIETNGNRELKQAWYINKFPGETWNAVCNHIYFTLFMFNVVSAFRSKKGLSLTEKGLISLRSKYFQPSFMDEHTVVVSADGYVATFSFKELLEILGLPPPDEKKKRGPKIIRYPDGKEEIWWF